MYLCRVYPFRSSLNTVEFMGAAVTGAITQREGTKHKVQSTKIINEYTAR